MADISSMSDDDLLGAYQQAQKPDVTKLSDHELMNAYQMAQNQQAPLGQPEYNGSSSGMDDYLAHSGIGRVLDAVGHGAKQGWGTSEIVEPDTADLLRKAGVFPDAAKPQHDIIRGFNEALLRPAAAGLDMAIRAGGQFMRATGAAISGVQAGIAQAGEEAGAPQLGRDVAGMIEAFPQEGMGLPGVLPRTHVPFSLDAARDAGVLGTEDQWKGITSSTEDFPVGTTAHYGGPAEAKLGEAPKPYEATISPDVQSMIVQPPKDIHEAARQIAPSVFEEFDSLNEGKDALREQIAAGQTALRQSAEAQAPHAAEIADLQERLQDTTPRLAKKYQARLDALIPERDAFVNDEFTMSALTRDTPEIAAMRQQLQEIDYRTRDLAPDVSAAYREAARQFPETLEEPAVAAPVAAPAPEPAAEVTPPVTHVTPPVEPEPVAKPVPVAAAAPLNIATDVSKKLVAAGRPLEEADAAGAVQEALWQTRAQAFGGAKGSAEEMYSREAPEIRAGRERARQPEFAQKGGKTFEQRKPVVAYRGTSLPAGHPSEFADPNGFGATFFTTDKEYAQEMADRSARNNGGNARVGRYELDIKNPAPRGMSLERARGGDAFAEEPSPYDGFVSNLGRKKDEIAVFNHEQINHISDVGDRSFAQQARGKIRLTDDGRAVITLFKNANASTFLHETGHDWLERMVSDAADPAAPQYMRDDADTVRKYLGNDGGDLTTSQHEKFARSFERYFMEGHAPSRGLASVFEKFRDWLTTIYQTVARLKAPITDDIRDVFDRLLTTNPERAVIAKEAEQQAFVDRMTAGLERSVDPAKISAHVTDDLAGLHETDAQTTDPEHAAAVADQVRQEIDETAKVHAPEVADELARADARPPATGVGTDAEAAPGAAGSHAGAGPDTEQAAGAAEPNAVNEGGGGAATEGAAGGQPGAAEPKLPPLDVKTAPNDFRTKADREIEKAANIRLDKINTTEDMNEALRDLAKQNGDFMDTRYGTRAYQTQLDIRNTRTLLRAATSDVMEAAVKAATGEVEAIADFVRKQQRAGMVFSHLSTLSADWAHAGHELNRVMPDWDKAMNIAQQIQDTTGRTLFQLQQQAAAMMGMPTAEQAGKLAGDAQMTRWQKARAGIISYFVNNLISGPITHMAYSIGNAVDGLYRAVPETLVQAAVGAARMDTDRVYFGEAGAQLYAMMQGAADGIMPAMKALKTGIAILPGQPEALGFRPQSIPGPVGYVLETPSRAVAAIHTLFYTMSYSQEIARLAFRDAAAKGLSGDAFNAQVARLTSSPTSDMMEAADTAATRGVLMKRPAFDSGQYHLSQFVNKYLAAKIIMPFMQIGMNILQEGLVERTPLSMLSSEARAELFGARGGAARDLRMGKIATGSTLASAVVGMAASGLMTGGGPVDPNQRRVLEDSGWKAYSIKVGDTYIPYRKFLGFLGPLVAGSADIYEVGHALHGEDLTKAAAALAFGFSEVVSDETWMSGLSNFMEAKRSWDTKGEAYMRNLATSFIPFSVGLSQTARMVDPYQRQARTLLDAARNKIPFASESLEPRIGIWGQPITSHTMVSPSTATNDPVDARLRALGLGVTAIPRKVTGINLTDQQYTNLAKTAGMLAHQRLTAMVQAPGFSQLPAGIQTKAIQETITKSREAARALVKMQNPAIIQQAAQNKQNLKINGRPGASGY